jgi:hypothetical protein
LTLMRKSHLCNSSISHHPLDAFCVPASTALQSREQLGMVTIPEIRKQPFGC